MEPENEEELGALEEEQPVVQKKRGKKKKSPVPEFFVPLPQKAIDGVPPEIAKELQLSYKYVTIITLSHYSKYTATSFVVQRFK